MRCTRLILLAMLVALAALAVGTASASAAELIPDNSYETTPFPSGYNDYHATASQVAVSNAPDGTHVAKIARSTGTSYDIDYVNAVANTAAGDVYDGSDYVEAANSGTAGKPIYLTIREENQSGTIIGTARSTTVNLTSTGFQHLTTSYTVKNSGDKLDIYALQRSAVSGNAFYDDLLSLQPQAATDTTAPSMPTNLSGTAGDTTASLTWSASSDNVGVTGYNVYRNGTEVASTSGTSYTDTGLTDGTTYVYNVSAYDAAGNESQQSAPTTVTPQAAPPPPSGHTVLAAPTGPSPPSGGWAVAYGDAFGTCLTNTSTNCSAGYARSDGTWAAVTHAHGDGNSNEIASFVPPENDITTNGLLEKCDATATSTDAYSCSKLMGHNASTGFEFSPTAGRFVLQFTAQMPPDEGNMDPAFWSTGNSYAWEIDHPELWGWEKYNTSGNTYAGTLFGFPSCPHPSACGVSGGENDLTWGSSPGAQFDPSATFHTYTLDIQPGASGQITATAYIDGVNVGAKAYYTSAFGSVQGALILQNDLRCLSGHSCTQGSTATTAVDGGNFPSAGNAMTVKNVAVYVPASQGITTGTSHSGLAPGTSVGP